MGKGADCTPDDGDEMKSFRPGKCENMSQWKQVQKWGQMGSDHRVGCLSNEMRQKRGSIKS